MSVVNSANQNQVQNRTVVLLSLAQIFSGLGTGSVVSVGSLLASELSGSEAWAGSITTAMTLGSAIAAMPLARLAKLSGRRIALTSGLSLALLGALGMILAGTTRQFWLLLLSGLMIGIGGAVNLQARFAATDLSTQKRRGRDLSLVVWMTTVGSVAGPNLIGFGGWLSAGLGLPNLVGLFIISSAGMAISMLVLWFGLRPDPYLYSQQLVSQEAAPGNVATKKRNLGDGIRAITSHSQALVGLIAVLGSHAVMVGVMSMTPVHLQHHGAELNIIGLTVSLHIAGMYALAPVMGILTDKIGGFSTVVIGMVILLASVIISGFSGHEHIWTTVGLVLLGLGWSAASVAGSTMIVNNVSNDQKLNAQGVSDMLMSLAGALGGALSGVALSFVQYIGLNIAAAIVIIVSSFVMFYLIGRKSKS